METTHDTRVRSQMSVGDWMITMLITAIPLIGLIMLFVWAFSESTPPSKSTWAKASLIWMAILLVLWLLFAVVFGFAAFSEYNSAM